ncbi:Polyisoprenoid-binding protein YceI [Chryseolinea serpens]|uniref:Polyisoprenoid-binding protein YceI n=1 Tax=Chryseolinea serpens TaxID=947013 RepID=A0A1M5RD49_9BACT|nr:YceI family protein [Chryseolinea serpens]SHH24267.1 Polyisoprenoid-binding protein YceI [Chryseolinea serpens]
MKKSIILFASLLSTTFMFAQTTWTIDNGHSKIGFSVTHMAVAETEGKFNEYSGALVSRNENFDGAEITFSAKTASIDTENERRDGHLKSPDFFDAAKYPDITFKGNLVKSGTKYKLKGDLTMHGVTKPVEFEVTGGATVNTGRGMKSGFKFTGTISRKDFGLTWSNTTPTGEMVVSDEVELNIKIELDKKA